MLELPRASEAKQSGGVKYSPRHFFRPAACISLLVTVHRRTSAATPTADVCGAELFIAMVSDWMCADHKPVTAKGASCPYGANYA